MVNTLSGVLYFFFYHPPTFNMKYKNRSKMQQFKDFDFVGCLLFTAGLLLFVMGLSWGGSLYAWKSSHVIGTIVAGSLSLVAFTLWEIYMPLKEPLVPMHLFKNIGWVSSCLLLALGARFVELLLFITNPKSDTTIVFTTQWPSFGQAW